MKNTGMILAVVSALFVSLTGFAQSPPPNDNFANATVLTGTDITFSGTLAGATLENAQEADAFDYQHGPAAQSVWWKWTAPVSTVLTLEVLSESLEGEQFQYEAGLAIYNATNGSTTPSGLVLPALGFTPNYFYFLSPTLSIPVAAGTDYYIQLVGSNSASYTIRLVATNTPIIIQQPRSQTVYSNASATFYVVAAGINQSNLAFQWRLDGTNLPDETAPMLALNNIDASMAGDYSVIVSNAGNYTISQPATLAISQSNFPISLATIGTRSNSMIFSLSGENGRGYRLEFSTNLVDWAPEMIFPVDPFNEWPESSLDGSVVFNTNSPLMVTVPNSAPRKFFRAKPYLIGTPDAEICINNLRQIRIAKILWARDYTESPVNTPSDSDIQHYFPHQTLPLCPDDAYEWFDTSYTVGSLERGPLCDIFMTKHLLEEAP